MEKLNLFEGSRIRTVRDNKSHKYWFSVVDICAAITGKEYNTARNYWKWFKRKLRNEENRLVSVTNQMKFLAADGKYRETDVMDIEDVLRLIQLCPSKNAEKFRAWIAGLASKAGKVAEKVKEAIVSAVKGIKDKFVKPVCVCGVLITTYRREFFVGTEEEMPSGEEIGAYAGALPLVA